MKRVLLCAIAMVLAAATQSSAQMQIKSSSSVEAKIRDLLGSAEKWAADRDVDKWMSLYAADAVMFPANQSALEGPSAIRAFVTQAFVDPHFSLKFNIVTVDVAQAEDMAVERGTYKLTFSVPPHGDKAHDFGKYVVVWKKQKDGEWKIAYDIFNTDKPM